MSSAKADRAAASAEKSASIPIPDLVLGGVSVEAGDQLDGHTYEKVVATGGMAHVLLVHDDAGQERALKVLKSSRIESGLPRFRREFHALRRVEHENVIRVYGWGSLRGHPYILMEYVEGLDLHTVIRAFKDLDSDARWLRCEQILADLCRALAYIHRRGLVHRDLKPSNVMVDGSGRCKLTDFGIVKDLDPASDPFVSTTLVGTWAYASPEQITGQAIDHRSDIYSLGVILYAMLTGRRPFAARDMAGYLAQHRDKRPMEPRRLDTRIPEHLEEICLKMLAKAPRDRFQSASEILDSLQQLDLEGAEPTTTDEHIWEPSLVGRKPQTEVLRDAVSALTRGQGGVVILEGAEGTGRSRMLRAAVEHAAVIGIPVHQGAITSQASSYDALVHIATDIGRELGARVPPELARAIAVFARGRGSMAGDIRYQLYDGVRETLETLLEDGPRIITVDDAHMAQAPLVSLLAYLVRTVVIRDALPLLVLVTARDDVDAPALDSFRDGAELGMAPTRVVLAPLSDREVRRLVVLSVGDSPKARSLSTRLYAETRGNPFYVAEFLRSLIQQNRPISEQLDELEQVDAATEEMSGHLEIPPGVRQVVLGRLARLDAHERHLVEALAVAGRETDQDVLLDVLEVAEDQETGVLDRLDRLVRQGFLVERGSAMNVHMAFAHHKVGEILYRDIDPARRVLLHGRYGEVLQELESDNPVIAEAIGEHFRLAGRLPLAYRFLVTGAARLWERSLLANAASLVARAAEAEDAARIGLPPEIFQRCRLDLLRVQGQLHFNTGSWGEAEQSLRDLREVARQQGEDSVAAHASLDLGTTLRRLGQTEGGEKLVLEVLQSARARHDRVVVLDALRRLASFAWEDGDLDEVERLANQGLIGATSPGLEEGRAELLLALTAAQGSRGHLAAATKGMSEAEEILRALRNKSARAIVLGNLAELHVWQGELGEAVERATAGVSLARDVLYREGESFILRSRAMALLDAGDLDGAAADLEAAYAIVQQLGVAEDLPATCYLLARLSLRQGDNEQALRHAQVGQDAAANRDPEGYAPALKALRARALARLGELDAAEEILGTLGEGLTRMPLPRKLRLELLMAMAWRGLGRVEEARRVASSVARVASARGFRMWALRALLVEADLSTGPARERAMASAGALARTLLAGLPEELSLHFQQRPGFGALWLAGADPDTEPTSV